MYALTLVLMALSAKVGAFNTGTGTSSIVVSDVGFQPKAILFWWSGRTGTTDAQGRESHFQGVGAATATTQRWAITTNDIDAAAAQDAATAKTATGCLLSVSSAGAIDGKADLASFDSGGFTLSVSDAFPRDQRVHYLALGGADITALRPDQRYQAMTAVLSATVTTTTMPPPAMPIAGIGPNPNISTGESGTSRANPVQIASEGTSMLPVPRSTLASAFISQTSQAPAKTTFE